MQHTRISVYIKGEVAAGKVRADSSQRQVDQVKEPFKVTPFTEPVGEAVTGSAQSQIDKGYRDIAYYGSLSNQLRIGGIILFFVGLGILLIPRKK